MPRKPSESAVRRDKAPPAGRPRPGAPESIERSGTGETPIPSAARANAPTPPPNSGAQNKTNTARRSPPAQESIATRAYHKWLARGCPPGDGKRDWLEAEQELSRETEHEPA